MPRGLRVNCIAVIPHYQSKFGVDCYDIIEVIGVFDNDVGKTDNVTIMTLKKP